MTRAKPPAALNVGFDERLWPIGLLILGVAGLAVYAVVVNSRFPDPATLDVTDRSLLLTGWFRLLSVAVFVAVAFGVVLCLQRWMSRRVLFCVLLGLLVHLCGAMVLRDQVLAVLAQYRAEDSERLSALPDPIRAPDYHWEKIDRPQIRQNFEEPVRTLQADEDRLDTERKEQARADLQNQPPPVEPASPPQRRMAEPAVPHRTDWQPRPEAEETAEEDLNRRQANADSAPAQPVALPAIPAAAPEMPSDPEVEIATTPRRQAPAPVSRREALPRPLEEVRSVDVARLSRQPSNSDSALEETLHPTVRRQAARAAVVPLTRPEVPAVIAVEKPTDTEDPAIAADVDRDLEVTMRRRQAIRSVPSILEPARGKLPTETRPPVQRLTAKRSQADIPQISPLAELPLVRQPGRRPDVLRLPRLELAVPAVELPNTAGEQELGERRVVADAGSLELDASARVQRVEFAAPEEVPAVSSTRPTRSSPGAAGLARATIGASDSLWAERPAAVPLGRKNPAMPVISGSVASEDFEVASADGRSEAPGSDPGKIEEPDLGRLARREVRVSISTPAPPGRIASVERSLPEAGIAGGVSLPRRPPGGSFDRPDTGAISSKPVQIGRRPASPVIDGRALGGAFDQRDPQGRLERARRHGGNEQTELAVEMGLAWFARLQFPDGHWSLNGPPTADGSVGQAPASGLMHADTAATGLALLAFLGAGYTHQEGKHRETVGAGIDWLLGNQQPGGQLYSVPTDTSKFARMYGHGIAAIALCEAYGMTGDAGLREPVRNAIRFIEGAQHPQHGGWRYVPGEESDTSVSGWQLMALKSAQLAGVEVSAEVISRVSHWLDTARAADETRYVYNPRALDTDAQRAGRQPSLAMTAEGILMRFYLGLDRADASVIAGADYLRENLPEFGTPERPLRDAYYWYYATQVMFQMEGVWWDEWNARIRPMLVSSQIRQGAAAGSWDPDHPVRDQWAHAGGRHYVTALNLLTLEVYYRYLPLFQALGE